jgi:formylglycine-generating enzyme required for sulfatase activity
MHCDKCNIDFPEGLRYCKWCGGALADHPRVTSELHACPSCSATVEPTWTYCKACGERLHGAANEPSGVVCPECGAFSEPGARNCSRCGEDLTGGADTQVVQDYPDTIVIAACSACGEPLDTGSLYCKACGSAVYTEPANFGGSAMLCGACNSYSAIGSRVCQVCGSPFAQAQQTAVDRPALGAQRDSKTLRDLDGHAPAEYDSSDLQQGLGTRTGANTLIFDASEDESRPVPSQSKPGAQTNVLPGTAGSRSELQTTTSAVQMGRITGPVEDQDKPQEIEPSGSSTESRQPAALVEDLHGSPYEPAKTDEPSVELGARPSQAPGSEATTSGFGSEPGGPPLGPDGKTEAIASPSHSTSRTPLRRVSEDDVSTREFAPQQPALEATREFQPPPMANTADQLRFPGETGAVPQWAGAEAVPPSANYDLASPVAGSSQPAQVDSRALQTRRTGVVIVSAIVALIVIAASVYAGWWFLFARGPRTAQPPPQAAEPPTVRPEPPAPSKPLAPVAPDGMLMLAAGTYTIGRDGAEPLEQPGHKVSLPAFFIDRSEVTNAAFKKFIDATGHKSPSNWTGASFPKGRDNYPVTGVTWQDAADYAVWAGKRLPSEAEWEAAARGVDGRIYPWGNDWRAGLANIGSKPDDITADQYPAGLNEVGRYPKGASPAGAVDMIGNAWEWVADEISLYPGNATAKLTQKPGVTYRVIRGGAYDGDKNHDATYRGYLDASQPYPKVGFRCAKDAK